MESAWSQLLEATSQLLLEFLSANICIYIYKQAYKDNISWREGKCFIYTSISQGFGWAPYWDKDS